MTLLRSDEPRLVYLPGSYLSSWFPRCVTASRNINHMVIVQAKPPAGLRCQLFNASAMASLFWSNRKSLPAWAARHRNQLPTSCNKRGIGSPSTVPVPAWVISYGNDQSWLICFGLLPRTLGLLVFRYLPRIALLVFYLPTLTTTSERASSKVGRYSLD
jgi:hypothetical protein